MCVFIMLLMNVLLQDYYRLTVVCVLSAREISPYFGGQLEDVTCTENPFCVLEMLDWPNPGMALATHRRQISKQTKRANIKLV